MISDQIIEDYLEEVDHSEQKRLKLKISLLLVSLIGLLFISLLP